jgi:flagellar biogenesis protein FliO
MSDHKTFTWQHGICCGLLLLVCCQANAEPTPTHIVRPTVTPPARPQTSRTEPAPISRAITPTSIYAANASPAIPANRGQPVPLHQTSERYGHRTTLASSGRINVHEAPVALSHTNDPHLQRVIYNNARPAKPASEKNSRLLSPSGSRPGKTASERKSAPRQTLISQFSQDPTVTTVAAMLLVFGLFLLSIWLVKRAAAKPTSALPEEVVSVLGRKQLAGREFAQLLHVGNKLVLVSVTSGGMKPITEVTDPVEVDRLLGICAQSRPDSGSAAFRQVFDRLARGTKPSEFWNNQPPVPIRETTEGHHSHPGRHRVG